MADKQRSGLDFSFSDGFFKDMTERDTLRFYRLLVRELDGGTELISSDVPAEHAVLLYAESGQGTARVNDYEVPLYAGVLFLCAGGVCRLMADPAQPLRYTCVELRISPRSSTHPLAALHDYFSDGTAVHMAQDAFHMDTYFTKLIAELCEGHVMPVVVRGLLEQLLIAAYRNFVRCKPAPLLTEPTVNAVGHTTYAIIRYVDEHLYSMHNLMEMAKDLGYSYNYLSHLFRRKTGMTIQSYVSRKKIERSQELLRDTKLSVTEIAAHLNYDCIQSFSKVFKRAMGMSPTEYREQLSNERDASDGT